MISRYLRASFGICFLSLCRVYTDSSWARGQGAIRHVTTRCRASFFVLDDFRYYQPSAVAYSPRLIFSSEIRALAGTVKLKENRDGFVTLFKFSNPKSLRAVSISSRRVPKLSEITLCVRNQRINESSAPIILNIH